MYVSGSHNSMSAWKRKPVKRTIQDYKQILLTGRREKIDVDKL